MQLASLPTTLCNAAAMEERPDSAVLHKPFLALEKPLGLSIDNRLKGA